MADGAEQQMSGGAHGIRRSLIGLGALHDDQGGSDCDRPVTAVGEFPKRQLDEVSQGERLQIQATFLSWGPRP